VLVAGLGVSGEAAARRLKTLGVVLVVHDFSDDALVRERATRLEAARVSLGTFDLDGVELVVTSPGVQERAPVLEAARAAGIPIWSEVELAWRSARAPILGVTGTNGKTTTTRMITAALRASGYRAKAAGNIGTPLCDAVAGEAEVIVAELSSFQLRHVVSFRAPVGVLLNLSADHLDWHGTFDAYARAKARLFESQGPDDLAVVYAEDVCVRLVSSPARLLRFWPGAPPPGGAGVIHGWITVPQGRIVEARRLRARGRGHLADAVAAAAAACELGADAARVGEALADFAALPHRMELIAEVGGVAFVNDSKATNPHATLAALEAMTGAVLIAGGRNKGLDLSALAAARGVRAVVAIGEAAGEVAEAFALAPVRVERASSMDEAVERAAALASPGDSVLLSPACASFDMFADYRARGEAFRAAVKRIEAMRGVAGGGGEE
jgi:UDP-N-acetylmuramoylalanine--D-glutamate ligase